MTDHPKRRLSRSPLTMIHVTPPDLVHHAARAGFDSVGIPRLPRRRGHRPAHARRQHPGDAQNPTTTQRHRPARLDVEVLRIRPDKNPSEALYILDAAAKLDATYVLVNCTQLSHEAAQRNLQLGIEFMIFSELRALDDALKLVREVDHPAATIVLDALHLQRSGGTPTS
jgi:sugar phosphate isomerase/epimerase